MFDKHIQPPSNVRKGGLGPNTTANIFQNMEPGDSVFFPFEGHIKCERPNKSRYYRAFLRVCEKNGWIGTGKKRIEDGVSGLRLWRIE